MGEHTDGELACRACGGNRGAFALLIERHYDRIYRVAARVLGDALGAQDVTQDVCIGLVTRLSSYRGDSRFTTWLYRVVVNTALDAVRRDATRRRSERGHAEEAASAHADSVERSEQLAWLRQVLRRLPEALRATAVLVLEEGLSHAETGTVLGVSEATVSWRMHQIRNRLRSLAADEEAAVQ